MLWSKILGWKVWGIIGLAIGAWILKLRGDGYKHEVENAKEETEVAKAEGDVKAFEAVNIEKAKQAERSDDDPIDDGYTGDVSI